MAPRARFDLDATDLDGVRSYYRHRAVQGLAEGWRWSGLVEPLARDGVIWGARTLADDPSGVVHQSVYVLSPHRGRRHLSRYLHETDVPFVTGPDCDLERLFQRHGVPYVVAGHFTQTIEYRAIEAMYGADCARRSGVPFMFHIDEGLAVLRDLGATDRARRAFCLHPLVQADADLQASYPRLDQLSGDPAVLLLALEYRNVANAYLSQRIVNNVDEIALSPLPEVNDMLRADKVQNYKDFLAFHAETHPRRAELDAYFRRWLRRLDVDDAAFARWREVLREPSPTIR